jgi:hypothetical protein
MAEATWRVRLFDDAGRVVGAGLVISGSHVLTCAHVAAAALSVSGVPNMPPGGDLAIGFPGLPDRLSSILRLRASVSAWWPDDDCALLGVPEAVPAGVTPARLRERDAVTGEHIRTFGHPQGFDDGVWSRGRVVGRGGRNPLWIQFDAEDTVGRPIEPGFSGAAVLDDRDEVLGMVVAVDGSRQARVAWMAPAGRLRELAGLNGAARPEATWEIQLEVAEALYELPAMRSPEIRQEIISTLPVEVSSAIRRSAVAKVDLFNLVRTCLDHEGSLSMLVRVLARFEGPHSRPFQELSRIIRERGLDGA